MSRIDIGSATPGGHGSHGLLGAIGHHFLHNWASALLVTSLIFIAKLNTGWLTAFDSYTYLVIGNVASSIAGHYNQGVDAAVVLIDQKTFEGRYQERSPLRRCQLLADLEMVYAQQPDIVAIDLDISPAVWLKEARDAGAVVAQFPAEVRAELDCEEQIYDLVSRHAAVDPGNPGKPIVQTVLVDPVSLDDSPAENRLMKDAWKRKLGRVAAPCESCEERRPENIHFADTELPIRFGMVLHYFTRAYSLPIIVRCLAGKTTDDSKGAYTFIDPRTIQHRLDFILLPATLDQESQETFGNALRESFAAITETDPDRKKVVFFGGGYGVNDVFVTPVGEVYGVEALAGVYTVDRIEQHYVAAFLLDFIIAILLGTYIGYCWKIFFSRRTAENPRVRQRATARLILLVGLIFVLMIVLVAVATFLITRCGIWLSPIPVAIGMLFDSLIFGAIEQALFSIRGKTGTHLNRPMYQTLLRPVFFGAWRLRHRDAPAAAVIALFDAICIATVCFAMYLAITH